MSTGKSWLSGLIGTDVRPFTIRSHSTAIDSSPPIKSSIHLSQCLLISHIPSRLLECGGLNCYWTPFCVCLSEFLPVDQFTTDLLSSRWAPANFFLMSLKIFGGVPIFDMDLNSALIKESVLRIWVNSRCTARIWGQLNKHPYRFPFLRPRSTRNGPN